jgi:hypothetical protein
VSNKKGVMFLSLLVYHYFRIEFKFASAVLTLGVFIIGFLQIHLYAEAVGTFEIGEELLDFTPLSLADFH